MEKIIGLDMEIVKKFPMAKDAFEKVEMTKRRTKFELEQLKKIIDDPCINNTGYVWYPNLFSENTKAILIQKGYEITEFDDSYRINECLTRNKTLVVINKNDK